MINLVITEPTPCEFSTTATMYSVLSLPENEYLRTSPGAHDSQRTLFSEGIRPTAMIESHISASSTTCMYEPLSDDDD